MAFEEYDGAMYGTKWKTSARKYDVSTEKDVKITISDGVKLSCDIFRPHSNDRFPAILGFHCYHQSGQTGPIKPTAISATEWAHPGQERTNASLENGDPNFFARRGYVHVVCNARGTGKSEGKWDFVGPRELQDVYETTEWISQQPWCDGNVAMFGVSYFGWIQLFAAMLNPPHLKTIFCPWGSTDFYRDVFYHGGIIGYRFPIGWAKTSLTYSNCRPENHTINELGENGYYDAISKLLQDEDIKFVPEIVEALNNPTSGTNPFIVDLLLHPYYDKFWEDRTVNYEKIKIPAYIGADWGHYGLHLPAAFRSWEKLDVPKKMIIGPPVMLDRPLYQLQHEAVRWFDHWMKGKDTGIMDEAPIKLFIMGSNEWKESNEWPLPETRWTPFYLHEDGLLSEHEHWPEEGSDSFEDSPWMRGHLKYVTPPMVENTEVVGPISLKLFASTTDIDIFWIITLLEIDPNGKEKLLTKGWLRGSHREIDEINSQPWNIIHPHKKLINLNPSEIYSFDISLAPTGALFRAGFRIGIKISGVDDKPKNPLEMVGSGSLRRQSISRITLHHSEKYPSCLILPITKGNIMNTYMSGGIYPM
ncbi:CocE/NonD family hydrolase [Chloroflexota bacterium]